MSHINPRFCRDYLHGSCDRLNCRYDHATAAELMEQGEDVGRLIFCRDFQRSNCFRPAGSCRFIHATTQDEQYYRVYKMLPLHLLQNLPSNISMTLLCPIQHSPAGEQYMPATTLLPPPMLPLLPGVMVSNVSTATTQPSPPPAAAAVAVVSAGAGLLPPYGSVKPQAARHSPILAATASQALQAVQAVDVPGLGIHRPAHVQHGVHHYANAMAHQQVLQVFPGLSPPTNNPNFAAIMPTMPRPDALMYGTAAASPHHRPMTSPHHRPMIAAMGSSVMYQLPPSASQRPNFLPYHGYQHAYTPKESYGPTEDSGYHGYSDMSSQPAIGAAESQTAHFSKAWARENRQHASISEELAPQPTDAAVPIMSSSPSSPMAPPEPSAVQASGEYGKSLESVSSVCDALSMLTLPDPLTDSVERVHRSDHHGDTTATATLETSTEETRA